LLLMLSSSRSDVLLSIAQVNLQSPIRLGPERWELVLLNPQVIHQRKAQNYDWKNSEECMHVQHHFDAHDCRNCGGQVPSFRHFCWFRIWAPSTFATRAALQHSSPKPTTRNAASMHASVVFRRQTCICTTYIYRMFVVAL